MNASVIKDVPCIARTFGRVQFETVFNYHLWGKSLIVRALIWLLIYDMTEKIMNTPVFISTAVQITNVREICMLSAIHSEEKNKTFPQESMSDLIFIDFCPFISNTLVPHTYAILKTKDTTVQ